MENNFDVVIGEEAIRERVRQLGEAISRDYAGKTPVLVAVLKGSVIFLADLIRAVTIPVNLDFMAITSFGSGGGRGGVVRIVKDLDIPISGREVIIVEDIIDTGLTLGYLIKALRARDPADIAVCTLLDRRARRLTRLPIRYVGFEVPDRFLVGYGLDHREEHRNLPYLAALPEEGSPLQPGGVPGAASGT
jgi:hypoxanthine phosphoribosyltransferase